MGMLVVVPAMRNTCTVFNKRCKEIKYQSLSNGELLIKDPDTSLTYWFDGNFIRSYGPFLPGYCPTSVSQGATGVYQVQGEKRVLCDRFDPDGVCVSRDARATAPTALSGTPFASSKGKPILEPAFVMNAKTMSASEQQVLCSRARDVVENAFHSKPFKKIKVRVPEDGTSALDVIQIFKALEKSKAYTPPSTNPEPPVCNGHGSIDPLTSLCICNEGWAGLRCATKLCVDDSACGHGVCDAGLCACEEGWTGDTCGLRKCPTPCVNGQCDGASGACACTPGFTGEACDEYVCVPSCGVHGECNTANGVCVCEEGWTGATCDNVACPNTCSGNGACNAPNGVCECVDGWVGVACDIPACTNNCSQHGECDSATFTCKCDAGWTGVDCAEPLCPKGCCAHGTCTQSNATWSCQCNPGWGGTDCAIPDNPYTSATLCPVNV
jgi:hypothetical protein